MIYTANESVENTKQQQQINLNKKTIFVTKRTPDLRNPN